MLFVLKMSVKRRNSTRDDSGMSQKYATVTRQLTLHKSRFASKCLRKILQMGFNLSVLLFVFVWCICLVF